ncbi:MAG TPA: hypothetical protein VHM90_02005, partial [Phycisphaerae bacterium]|nr:hypothetical protein [Phycisphaerae bacterium]
MVFGKQLCLRWMVVAAVVASAGLPRVRAQEAAPPQYSGWVHIVVDEKTSYDYEIATGAMTQQWRSSAGMEVEYVLPKLLEQYQYSPVTQTIYRGSMNPVEAMLDLERVQETPVTVDAMLAILRQSLGADAVEVKEEEDRGMMRYTIKAPPAKANLKLGVFGNGTRTPTALWAETASKRVREVQFENRKMQVSYDRPVNSVYDAGAPRGATLVDNRASADTWAVYNRIQARIAKPFSDGVLARVRADRQNGKMVDYSIEVVGRKGAEWSVRGFPILGDEARDGAIRLPEEWAGAGSEELF